MEDKPQDIKFESKDIKVDPHPEYFINIQEKTSVTDFFKKLFSGKRRVYILSGITVLLVVSTVALIYYINSLNKQNHLTPPPDTSVKTSPVLDHRDDPQKYIDETTKLAFEKVKDSDGTKNYDEALSYLDERIDSNPDNNVKQTLRLTKSDLYYKNGDYNAAAEILNAINQQELSNYTKLGLYSRLSTVYKHLDQAKSEEYQNLVFETAEAYEKEQYKE